MFYSTVASAILNLLVLFVCPLPGYYDSSNMWIEDTRPNTFAANYAEGNYGEYNQGGWMFVIFVFVSVRVCLLYVVLWLFYDCFKSMCVFVGRFKQFGNSNYFLWFCLSISREDCTNLFFLQALNTATKLPTLHTHPTPNKTRPSMHPASTANFTRTKNNPPRRLRTTRSTLRTTRRAPSMIRVFMLQGSMLGVM